MSENNQSQSPATDVDTSQQNVGCENEIEDGWRVSEDIYIPPPPQIFGEYDTKGPRLMIVKIVAKNFKSYAGTIEIGPFNKCFSSIVGPNGNGKSNAIDSMLFVFGYRATKIRSKKIAELIHHSNEHPSCASCSVHVHFHQIIDKPGHEYDIVPNSEFVISRTAFKDSSSHYELNGKKVQFKQIAQVLRSHHVDLDHNRFLILQGEVEQIALMKPKGQGDGDTGMLEFLEDIIGTTRYKEPLEKLHEKVEYLSEEREEKLRRLKVVEKAKTDLEGPMQEALQYLMQENDIVKAQHRYLQCKRYETENKLATEEESKKELDEDFSKLSEEMKNVQKERDEKTKDFKEKSKKWEKLQQQKDALTIEFDEIRKKDEALHAESVATNKRRKDNMNTVKNEKSKLEELQRVPAKNEKDIEECNRLQEKHIAEREKEEAALVTLMSGLKEKTEPLMKKRSTLEKDLVSHRKIVDEAKSNNEIAKSKLDLYTSEETTEKNKLERLQESIKVTVERIAENKRKLSEIEPKIPLTEKSLKKAQTELENLKARENEVGIHLRNSRAKYDQEKSAMQAGRSRNHILNSLMREKREGRLPGIFGRLGDLGAIDAKFDVAVSTACGPLDNIVVDTVDTATQCIEFLRRNDIGRATFIALEKQQRFARQCQEKIRTPENVHRLFDLIKVEDQRVLPAFYYAIQNTLVADNLDQATRIAYGAQRYRVVTLKGELIELSGTMSGGGRQMARGRMGQKVARSEPSAQDIEKLQGQLDAIFAEYNQIKAEQPPLEDSIRTLTNGLKDLVVDRDKCKIELSQLMVEEPNLRKQLKEQEIRAKAAVCDASKVEELTKIVKDTEKKLKRSTDNSKETEIEVERINQEIDEISGSRVKEQQKKISNLTRNIDKTKGEICRLQVAIKTAERNAKKAEQRIETLETDIKNCEQRIRDIQKEKQAFEVTAKGIMEQLQTLNEELEERDELAGKLKAELDKLQSRESKMKALKIDLDQKLNEKNKILKELKHRIPEILKSLTNLKLQDVPNTEPETLNELSKEELEEIDIKTALAQYQKAKDKLPTEIPNMQIIEQYKEQNALYLKRTEKLQKITEERNRMRDVYSMAIRKRMQEFNAGFTLITGKLKEMYRMITLGGDAELELVDSLDPFSEGIVFSVRPPKKSWKYIQNLSGGEKTLSSLALVFALHHYKPTPVYFMDEIDAALDFKNVSIVASYIKERTKNAQFIVISHRSDMFELADYLVGIYKIFNCSKCAVVDVKKFNAKVGIPEHIQPAHQTRPQFFSQPNPAAASTFANSNNENRISAQPRPVQIPSTCPENINKPKENSNAKTNVPGNVNQQHNDSNSISDLLGDLELPCTPVKQPSEPKRRKIDKSPKSKKSEKISATLLENNDNEKEDEDDTLANRENENETNISLRLGDVSLPATPATTTNGSKKRKAEKTPIPRRAKSLRRNDNEDDLQKVSKTLEKRQSSSDSQESQGSQDSNKSLRRTSRTLKKAKLPDDMVSPLEKNSSKKRRK